MRIKLAYPIKLSELSRALGTTLSQSDATLTHVCTDTRKLRRGDLFIALKGERFDGEDFVAEAIEAGAYTIARSSLATLSVGSVTGALSKIISLYLEKLIQLKKVVGITGSVGKTTTKELLRALLKNKFPTHATDGNQNNLYGVLFTVLSAPADTELIIIEMGMNSEGEIKTIADATNPNIAVITNIGTAHIGKLGSREAIARAKLEICSDKTEITVVPHGEDLLVGAKGRFTYSTRASCADAYFIPLVEDRAGTLFDLYSRGEYWREKRLPILGEQTFECFCAALSVARYLGLTEGELDAALPTLSAEQLRQRFIKVGPYLVYDDSYSASYEATVATLKMLKLYGEPVSAVLFDMLELGDDSKKLHRLVGRRAAQLGIKRLFAVGEFSGDYARGAISGGMKKENIHINNDINDLTQTISAIRSGAPCGILLVKGSHKARAERVIDYLKKEG